MKLQQLVTDPKFQQEHLSHRGRMQSSQLLDMILSLPQGNTRDWEQASKQSSQYNENQMLADLIQQQAIKKHKHRASLPLKKLMKQAQRLQK